MIRRIDLAFPKPLALRIPIYIRALYCALLTVVKIHSFSLSLFISLIEDFYMTLAYWCVLVAACLPYPFTLLAKATRGFDNHYPREYLEKIQGWRKRAHWVQLNSFEAFAPFAAGVIIAHLSHVSQSSINNLSLFFIACRIFYGIFYLLNLAALRSLAWFGGIMTVITLFVLSASTPS